MVFKSIERKRQYDKLRIKKIREQNMLKNSKYITEPTIIDNYITESSKITVDNPIIEVNELNGYIYCLSNPAFEGLYKIGFTTTSISQRLSQLNNTSVPFNFKCEFNKKVFNCRDTEKKLHSIFSKMGKRVNDKREFFQVDLLLIKEVFDLIEEHK